MTLFERFYITFIYQNRYQFFLDGFSMTLLLTLSTFVLGTLLGALFCFVRFSKSKVIRKVVDILVGFFVELPTLVWLLICAYVIFVNTNLSVVIIVILGLTLKAASYMCDIFYTAVNAVNDGEAEAARTLGMTKYQAFLKVTLPQAVKNALPIYKNQFIITMQETSIVGYLAIQDLTRASSIVTSRTLDALFGVIVVALIYILIGYVFTSLLNLLGHEKHLTEKDIEGIEIPEYNIAFDSKGTSIKLRGVKKVFDETNLIFENVDLDVNTGEAVVIIGGSGCGKSTLLRCINRLIEPTEGEIYFNDENILDPKYDIDAYRKRAGMVFQQFNLFSHLNVLENIILAPMLLDGKSKEDAIAEAMMLLRKVGMENRAFQMPSELSGGQKQRVAITRALAMHPDVILFDEPTSALDPTMVEEVETVIRRLIDFGMTSIIVTHEMDFAANVASKVVFLAEKSIYEQGPAAQIFKNPSRELTRQFLYRSRFCKETVTAQDIDVYALCSKLRAFASQYGMVKKQSRGIEYLCEEILVPLNKLNETANVYLECSSKGDEHTLIFEFPGMKDDPLSSDKLDEIGLMLAKGFTKTLTTEKNGDDNWEVVATL